MVGAVCVADISACATVDLPDTIENSVAVSVAAPLVASYGAAYGSKASIQSSAISTGMPPSVYAVEINKAGLVDIARANGMKFYEPWKYMGSKNGYHYFAIYPFLDLRKVYRIHLNEFSVDNEFELTSQWWNWREYDQIEHLGITYRFDINTADQVIELYPSEAIGPLWTENPLKQPGPKGLGWDVQFLFADPKDGSEKGLGQR